MGIVQKSSDSTNRAEDRRSADRDRKLLQQIAGGDLQAFNSFYARHSHRAYGLALRIAGDPRLAEDALQEAFLGVWRGASRFDAQRGSAATWLLTLVHHRAVDVVRYQERRSCDPLEGQPERGEEDGNGEAEFSPHAIRALLATLPQRQRELLVWAHYEGLSQAEISTRAGIPLGTVKSRMFNAYGALRGFLPPPHAQLQSPG
ncbi:MAG: sigma-70 family RNA polymerase sigma factor [Actinomycetota bacterium]|nr:sigma-70 family RNA polymerase sigma factor [Actinomycetota bacterium]